MLTLKGHVGRIRGLSFSADETKLASAGGSGKNVSVWDLATQKRVYLGGFTDKVTHLAFAPRGDLLVACDRDAQVRFWRPDPAVTGKPMAETLEKGTVFAFTPTGEHVLVAFQRNLIIRGVAGSVDNRHQGRLPEGKIAYGLACSPDGNWAALIDQQAGFSAILVNLADTSVPVQTFRLSSKPNALTFSPDSKYAVLGVNNGIEFWNVADGTHQDTLKGHGRVVLGLGYLPDGRLVSCSTDGSVKTWEAGKCRDTRDWAIGPLHALTVAGDGMRAAVGSENGTIFVWDVD
jgi:WD40 repeat protein